MELLVKCAKELLVLYFGKTTMIVLFIPEKANADNTIHGEPLTCVVNHTHTHMLAANRVMMTMMMMMMTMGPHSCLGCRLPSNASLVFERQK